MKVRIEIRTFIGENREKEDKPESVEAEVIPPFGLHETYNGDGYTLTHIPSGLSVVQNCKDPSKLVSLALMLGKDDYWLNLTESVEKLLTKEEKQKYTNKLIGCKSAIGL